MANVVSQPSCLMALSIGVDIGLFHLMVKYGNQPKKAEAMAETLGIHPPLLCKYPWNIPNAAAAATNVRHAGRLMRHMAAMGYVIEVGADEYKPTNFTKSLTIPIIGDGYPCM